MPKHIALTSPEWSSVTGVFNVRAYGAVGDGATNDLPAFRSASAAAYAWGQSYPNIASAKVVIPSGDYVLSGTWDLTLGDPLGSVGGNTGYGRIQVEGMGRYNTTLVFTNSGTTNDAIHIGAYTVLRDFGMIGYVNHGIYCVPETGSGVSYPGRAGERILLERIFNRVTPATGCYSIYMQAPFFMKFDSVQTLGSVVLINNTGTLHNSYDNLLVQCEFVNALTPWSASLVLDGWNFILHGGNIYPYLSSTQPGVYLRHGSAKLHDVDMGAHGVTSMVAYDIVVDYPSGSTDNFTDITVEGCAFGLAGRSNATGSVGTIWFKSGTRGWLKDNWYETPSIYISTGTQGITIDEWSISSSAVSYDGGPVTTVPSASLRFSDLHVSSRPLSQSDSLTVVSPGRLVVTGTLSSLPSPRLYIADSSTDTDRSGSFVQIYSNDPGLSRVVFDVTRLGGVKVWDWFSVCPFTSITRVSPANGAMFSVGSDLGPSGTVLALTTNPTQGDYIKINGYNAVNWDSGVRKFTFADTNIGGSWDDPGILIFGDKIAACPALRNGTGSDAGTLLVRTGDESSFANVKLQKLIATSAVSCTFLTASTGMTVTGTAIVSGTLQVTSTATFGPMTGTVGFYLSSGDVVTTASSISALSASVSSTDATLTSLSSTVSGVLHSGTSATCPQYIYLTDISSSLVYKIYMSGGILTSSAA